MKSLQTNYFKINKNPKKLKIIYFSRKELCNILSAYSTKVSEGIWKDYAIDNSIGFALFSIFRNTYEKPILMIQKSFINNKKIYMFSLMSQNGNITNSKELKNILNYLIRMPKLVKWLIEKNTNKIS